MSGHTARTTGKRGERDRIEYPEFGLRLPITGDSTTPMQCNGDAVLGVGKRSARVTKRPPHDGDLVQSSGGNIKLLTRLLAGGGGASVIVRGRTYDQTLQRGHGPRRGVADQLHHTKLLMMCEKVR